MTKSTTRFIYIAQLSKDGDLASLVLRLMMSVNDIAMANNAMTNWSASERAAEIRRKDAGLLYFGRIQSGHSFEALEIVKQIAKTPKLRAYVDECDATTIGLFSKLETFVGFQRV